MRKFLRVVKNLILLALLVVSGIMIYRPLREFHVVERLRYGLGGMGEQGWEEIARQEGTASSAEEYYYGQLSDDLKEVYRELYVRIMRYEDAGPVFAQVNLDDFWKVYYGVLNDHPEIFWLGASAQVSESSLTGHIVSYEFESIVPSEIRDDLREELEDAADLCVNRIDPYASDYEKIKFVYEYIIDQTEYGDAARPDSQNIQSVLLNRKSVCAGYSRAFQYILHRCGMFCTYLTGKIADGGDHGWNMVRLDGNYYFVDVTWGDPVFVNQEEGTSGDSSARGINYNYLCCTAGDLYKTHIPDERVALPPCDRDDYNYYKLNNCYFETFSYDTVYSYLMNSVWNGEESAVLKFGSREAFEQAETEMFEGKLLNDAAQYLMQINGVSRWNYRYHTDDDFYVITLYWYS